MEIKVVRFVVKGSAKLIVSPDRMEQILVGKKSVAHRRVFDIKFIGIRLTEKILSFGY